MYKLGIDVGGTNTDAVIIDGDRKIIAEVKHPTSGDIYDGILGAIGRVLELSEIDRGEIRQAMLGRLHAKQGITIERLLIVTYHNAF